MRPFFGIICPRRVAPSRANAAMRHRTSETDIPHGLPPRRAETRRTKRSGHTPLLAGWRGVGERSEPTRGRESGGCARKRDRRKHEARTSAEGKRREEGKPAAVEEREEAARAATRPNRKRRRSPARQALSVSAFVLPGSGGREGKGRARGEAPRKGLPPLAR